MLAPRLTVSFASASRCSEMAARLSRTEIRSPGSSCRPPLPPSWLPFLAAPGAHGLEEKAAAGREPVVADGEVFGGWPGRQPRRGRPAVGTGQAVIQPDRDPAGCHQATAGVEGGTQEAAVGQHTAAAERVVAHEVAQR